MTDLANALAEIRAWHRKRVFMMEQRKRSDLALGAYLRVELGWSKDLPKSERDAIASEASEMMAAGERQVRKEMKIAAGKKPRAVKEKTIDFHDQIEVIKGAIQGRIHFSMIEEGAAEKMDELGRSLPIWSWFSDSVFKSSAVSLAVILAETGDLSCYAGPAKLWKRMGLAVMNGTRQGGLRKTAGAQEWIEHGYSARRRAIMFVIGDVLVKQKGPYRDLYLQRKEIERAKAQSAGLTIAPAAKIPEKRKHEFMSDGHIHRRAQRYMEKRLLRDLWQAWRQTHGRLQPKVPVSAAATSSAQAERPTTLILPPCAAMSGESIPAQAGMKFALWGALAARADEGTLP